MHRRRRLAYDQDIFHDCQSSIAAAFRAAGSASSLTSSAAVERRCPALEGSCWDHPFAEAKEGPFNELRHEHAEPDGTTELCKIQSKPSHAVIGGQMTA